jgi:hypothetical protein
LNREIPGHEQGIDASAARVMHNLKNLTLGILRAKLVHFAIQRFL